MLKRGMWLVLVALFALGCAGEVLVEKHVVSEQVTPGLSKGDSSVEALFVNFEFDGIFEMNSCFLVEKRIEEQLLYSIGQLNGDRGVSRLDSLQLSDVETSYDNGTCLVSYHARMLVAWGVEHEGEETYELILPSRMNSEHKKLLFEMYHETCTPKGSHADEGSLWYYWRPEEQGCVLNPADVVRLPVSVSSSPIHTTGKYPEYHKVWEDNALEVIAIFGMVEKDGGDWDTGVKGYNKFIQKIRSLTQDWEAEVEPADVDSTPGLEHPDVTIEATLPNGTRLKVVALLVDDIKTMSYGFYERYEKLTPTADLLIYGGHSGLGANIRTLAGKGEWATGQYTMVFMNGCDSYAYVDSALAEAHAAVNSDDPLGTKYVDILTNAMPSYFYTMADSAMTLTQALLDYEAPKTYEQIFVDIDSKEMILVSGEEDNEFVPGWGSLPGLEEEEPTEEDHEAPALWDGQEESGSVGYNEEYHFSTPVLAPGKYRFSMTGTLDPDLFIRVGEAPTQELYDCRPFSMGAEETCEVELNTSTTVHGLIHAWSGNPTFFLVAKQISVKE